MGNVSLAALYFMFSFCSFLATAIVNKCGERFCMTVGAMCYTLYTAAFIVASAPKQYPSAADSWALSDGFIKFVIIICAMACGFGASILWVAQGRYISRVANNENKGTYNSIFWAFFMSTQLIGPLFAALVLKNIDTFPFYCIMTAICFFAALFFLILPPIKPD